MKLKNRQKVKYGSNIGEIISCVSRGNYLIKLASGAAFVAKRKDIKIVK